MIKIYLSSPLIISEQHSLQRLYKNLVDFGYEVLGGFTQREYVDPEFLINECEIFIAYLVNKNPNVIFELGYASALGKNILILADKADDIPDSLKNCAYIKIDGDLSSQTYRILSLLDVLSTGKNKKITDLPTNYEEFFLKYKVNELIIEKIPAIDFEYFIFKFLKDHGFDPENSDITKGVGYGYAHVFLNNYRNYHKTLIEIKKYNMNNNVSVDVVKSFYGSMIFHNADYGILISSSSFTSSAKDYAKSLSGLIELWDIEYLIGLNKPPTN